VILAAVNEGSQDHLQLDECSDVAVLSHLPDDLPREWGGSDL
jgi:hypothetical protein